ncbi:MAG TPA: hypothetical protein VJN93_17255 [Candidatus Acidoferrum sp.]|nr:hypothetical protein [Candidatus Acidoferrum sp.]
MFAKKNYPPHRRRGRAILRHFLEFCLLFSLFATCTSADALEDGARILARRVSITARSASVSCEFRNLANLGRNAFTRFTAAFEAELQRRGVRLETSAASVNLVVRISRGPAEYIGVAEILRKEGSETVMESLGSLNNIVAPEPPFSLILHREFLFSDERPILDVLLNTDGKHAAALSPDGISAYELQGDDWVLTGSGHLPVLQPPQRDERGFLFSGIDSQAAYLPGEICTISALDKKGWNCAASSDPMPVRTVSPDVMAGKKIGAWISAAQFESAGKTKLVVTGQEGLARLFEDGSEPLALFPDWGGQIASIYSGCGSGWQLLVTGTGDWTQPDRIQAVDLAESQPQTVSDPMEFPGPILALHAPGTRTADNATANSRAVAVDRNLLTGRYEAYLLSIACSR